MKKLIKYSLILFMVIFIGFGLSFKINNKKFGVDSLLEKSIYSVDKTGIEEKYQLKVSDVRKILDDAEVDVYKEETDSNGSSTGERIKIRTETRYAYIDDTVATGTYKYKGNNISESVNLRTPNTKVYEINKDGYKNVYDFSVGKPYYKSDGIWKNVKIGTTTPSLFEKQTKETNIISRYFKRIFPSAIAADYYTGAGDGIVRARNYSSSWSSCHNYTNANQGSATDYGLHTETASMVQSSFYSGTRYIISRMFLPIDTSAITDTDTVDSVALYVRYATWQSAGGGGASSSKVFIVSPTSASSTSELTSDDYDTCGPTHSPNIYGYYSLSISTTAYTHANLTNTTPISKTSYTLLGLRTGDDVYDRAATANNGFEIYMYDNGSNSPYIRATTTAGITANPIIQTPLIFD